MCTLTAVRSRFRSVENNNLSVAELGYCTRFKPQTAQVVGAMPPGKGRWGKGKVPASVYAGPAPAGKGSQSPVTPEWPSKGKGTAKGKVGPSPPMPAQSRDCRNHVSVGGALRASDTGKGKTSSGGSALRASDTVAAGGALRASGTGKGKSSAEGKASAGRPSDSVGSALRASGTGKGDNQPGPHGQAEPKDPPQWRSFGPTGFDGKYRDGL